MTPEAACAFVVAQTAIGRAPLVPEVALHLASEITPIWQATEQSLARQGVEPPYWAFAWPGGQALARFVLDHPSQVAGRRVLDFAAGCGIAAIAAARAGGAVTAAEIDPLAAAAIRTNAALNGVTVAIALGDPLLHPAEAEVILAGDVCYEARMTARVVPWLRVAAGCGITVLLADPGRAYLPREGLVPVARYDAPVTRELEDRLVRETILYRVLP
jgi:predicted nicotinamide N-methyase